MAQPPVITIFTADTGHTSIAQALEATLQDRYQVNLANVSMPGFSLYYPFYRYFPQLSQIGFKAAQRKSVYKALHQVMGDSYRLKITEFFARHRPNLVMSTYHIANPTIEHLTQNSHIPFINILPDPRTINAFLPSPQALNCVFDQQVMKHCRDDLHIPAAKLLVTGWFVRPNYQPANRSQVRQALRLPVNQLTFLVAAGSEGTNLVLKIIPTFLQSNPPLTVVVSCGHNRQIFSTIKQIDRANRIFHPNSRLKLIPLAFTDKLYRYLQAADLTIGKAGPNLLFESVAVETPFFAITHVSGQEDGNLDIIREYRLGLVEENTLKANRLLNRLIHHPDQLAEFIPHLKHLAARNSRAPALLHREVARLLTQSSPVS